MSAVDPTGRLVVMTRDAAAVAAITNRVRGGEKAPGDAPPYAVVVPIGMTPFIGAKNGNRSRLAGWRHAIRCYGPKVQGGDRQAEALGLAVVTSLHQAGPVTFPASGSGTAGIYQIEVESMGGPLRDPDSGEPYVIVTTYLSATGQSF